MRRDYKADLHQDIATFKGDITKAVTEIGTRPETEIGKLRSDMVNNQGELRSEMTKNIGELRSETTKNVGELRSETTKNVGELRSEMTKSHGELKSDMVKGHWELKSETTVIKSKLKWLKGLVGTLYGGSVVVYILYILTPH